MINNPLLESENVIIHASYLINGSSDKLEVKQKSYKRLLSELLLAEKLNVQLVVFHPGCNKNTKKGLDSLIILLKYCLENTTKINIIIENMTKTNTLCQSWEDIKYVLDKIDNKRIGVCLDTAHCWGAGKKET